MKPLDYSKPPEHVCVMRLSALGDVCHTLPVINTLRATWPETDFTWIIGKLEAQLIGDVPGIEFISFDKAAGRLAYRELRQALAGRRFDLLLHMQMSLRASLASRAVRAPVRLGFDRKRAHDYQWLFTNRRIPHVEREHVMESFFGFARTLGVTKQRLEWGIPIPDAAKARAQELIPDGENALILSPCANARRRNWRNWPFERYAPIVDFAAHELGWHVILTGGPSNAEREAAEIIVSQSNVEVLNLQGTTTLKELLALIARARVLIAPDSGPVHMATALGTPVIGLYATTNPDRAGPYLSQQWRINRYPDAVSKYLDKTADDVSWGTRVRNPEAMALITPDQVIAALARFANAM